MLCLKFERRYKMIIELLTTKRKLTKSIISQLRQAPLEVLISGHPLGFVIGVKKNCYKIIIIQFDKDYYYIEYNWKLGEKSITRILRRGTQTVQFETEQRTNHWWDNYQRILKLAQKQIYI